MTFPIPSIFTGLLKSARPVAKPKELSVFRLPDTLKPSAPMKRVILHWTAGSYVASGLDREHYHILIEGGGAVVAGKHKISANADLKGKTSDQYAAHTKNCNTGSIGVSICASAGAVEAPYNAGKYPLTEAQWQRAAEVIADLCRTYRIEVSPKTVLTHAEVQPTLGITQAGKWDIARLPWNLSCKGAKACGDDLRARVMGLMK